MLSENCMNWNTCMKLYIRLCTWYIHAIDLVIHIVFLVHTMNMENQVLACTALVICIMYICSLPKQYCSWLYKPLINLLMASSVSKASDLAWKKSPSSGQGLPPSPSTLAEEGWGILCYCTGISHSVWTLMANFNIIESFESGYALLHSINYWSCTRLIVLISKFKLISFRSDM